MPIYVYKCLECGTENETISKEFTQVGMFECPHCQTITEQINRIKPSLTIFKGSGFHRNDYAKIEKMPQKSWYNDETYKQDRQLQSKLEMLTA